MSGPRAQDVSLGSEHTAVGGWKAALGSTGNRAEVREKFHSLKPCSLARLDDCDKGSSKEEQLLVFFFLFCFILNKS